MLLAYLVKGFVIGFSLAVPVGPIALLCIRRTLTRGTASGVASGLGAATADGIYSLIAAFGITFIANFLFSHNIILRLVGGGVLSYIGVTIFLSVPGEDSSSTQEDGLVHDYVSALLLTFTNPILVVAFAAAFAAAGVGYPRADYLDAAVVVVGVVLGSTLWWLILSGAAGYLHGKISNRMLTIANRVAGTILAGFGLIVLLSLVLWSN